MYATTGEDDIGKLRKMVKTYRPDRVLVVGGDGTIKLAAQACHDRNISIGIIPGVPPMAWQQILDFPRIMKKHFPWPWGIKS